MTTECRAKQLEFEGLGRRDVVASFDGNHVSSDGGLLLLREVARRTKLFEKFAACFHDYRDPLRIKHTVQELMAQRVLAIACGYEDLVDHERLRNDPLFAVAVGKEELDDGSSRSHKGGRRRARKVRRIRKGRGMELASPCTLNRVELTAADADASERYCKVVYDEEAINEFFVQMFLDAHDEPRKRIVLDLDATDDPLHGKQEGRFFHGYYRHYCYLPLYIFCGDFLLCAKLRGANADASDGALEEVERIVARIRERWPQVEIILRADSGFARDTLMAWAEENGVHFVFGLARNKRLQKEIADDMALSKTESEESGKAVRRFRDLRYRTLKSWSRERRVVAKAEYLPGKENPRFVVTSLGVGEFDARTLYEDLYCARGDMENRIKEQQLDLFADRTSAHTMRANQLRLYLASVAYVLINALRHFGLHGTEMARAQAGTIRSKLLKIGAIITISVRRVVVKLSRYAPVQELFATIVANLRRRIPVPG